MIVLSIDIGSANYAYSILDVNLDSKEKYTLIKSEYLKLTHPDIGHRLLTILKTLKKEIEKYKPEKLVYEDSKFAGRSAPALHYVVGLTYICGATFSIPVQKYSPTQVKKKLTGDGKADKKAVEAAVISFLSNPPEKFLNDHCADSCAIGLCPFI